MPVTVSKVKGGYRVSTPSGTKAKKTTKSKAMRQKRLLNAIDHSDWRPTGRGGGNYRGRASYTRG